MKSKFKGLLLALLLTTTFSMKEAQAGLAFVSAGLTHANPIATSIGVALIVPGAIGAIATADQCVHQTELGCFIFAITILPVSGFAIILDEEGQPADIVNAAYNNKYEGLFSENPDALSYINQLVAAKLESAAAVDKVTVRLSESEVQDAFMNSDVDFGSELFKSLVLDLN